MAKRQVRKRSAKKATPQPGTQAVQPQGEQSGERYYTRSELRAIHRAAAQGKDRILTPGQVAVLCNVDPKTVTRWAKAGGLRVIKLKSGHRRYSENGVYEDVFELGPDE